MNYGSLRRHLMLRYMKAVGDGGGSDGGGVSTPSVSDTSTPSPGGDGGGSSVATPSDGGGTPSAPPSPDNANSDPWAALGEVDLDSIEVPQTTTLPTPPSTPAPATPQTAPAQPQTPPVAPQQPQATSPQPQNPQPQTAQPPANTPPQADLSPSDPVALAAAMEENMPALIQHVAQQRFTLTPEEVQELESDVTTAVPKLLAKVHIQSQIAMQRFLAQAVPGMIQRHTQVSNANSAAEDKFFSTHKDTLGLDKNNPQHRSAAVRVAKMYRQMYPQASLDQLISDIGPMVAQAVGSRGGTTQPQAQPTPGTVMVGGTPFRPAVNGGGTPTPSTPTGSDNQWAGLGQDFD